MKNLFAIAAAALLATSMISTVAVAQATSPGSGGGPTSGPGAATLSTGQEATPGRLDVDTTGALFSDPNQAELRPDTELQANFGGLSAEEQAAVRAECERIEGGGAVSGAGWTQLCERVQGF